MLPIVKPHDLCLSNVDLEQIALYISILMKISTLVVKILLRYCSNIKRTKFWGVFWSKSGFEQLNLCHSEPIVFQRNWRWQCRKHPLKISLIC